MDKSQIKAPILKTVESEIDVWLEAEPKFTDPFEYEKSLLERTLRIGKAMLEQGQGKVFLDRNFLTSFRQL